MLIVVSGLPGTGKTRLAEALGRSLKVPVFAVA
jgi:MoxR-like ATPase